MLGKERMCELHRLAIDIIACAQAGHLYPDKSLVPAATDLAYGFLMLSRGNVRVVEAPPEAVPSCDEPDPFVDYLRALADAQDDFLVTIKTEYAQHLNPGIRHDVESASIGQQSRRETGTPAQRLTFMDSDGRMLRAELLEAVARVIKEHEGPDENDFIQELALSTGILDVRSEEEIDAEIEDLSRRFQEFIHKHKDDPSWLRKHLKSHQRQSPSDSGS